MEVQRGGNHIAHSLIVGPHAQDPHGPLFAEDLIHHTVLNVDPAGVGTSEVSDQLLKGWRILKWVVGKNRQHFLRLGLEPAGGKLLGVFECLLGKHNLPTHHFSAFALFANGSAMPALMDSRIPGTASKYSVS